MGIPVLAEELHNGGAYNRAVQGGDSRHHYSLTRRWGIHVGKRSRQRLLELNLPIS